MVNVKLNSDLEIPVVLNFSLSARLVLAHVHVLGLVLDQNLIGISQTEQAALFTLLSTILPKRKCPTTICPATCCSDTFPQAEKLQVRFRSDDGSYYMQSEEES